MVDRSKATWSYNVWAPPTVIALVAGTFTVLNPTWRDTGYVALAGAAVTYYGVVLLSWIRERGSNAMESLPLEVECNHSSCRHQQGNGSLRRVRIRNPRKLTTIQNVEVKLLDFTPQGATFLPALLERTHKLIHPFNLSPKDDATVDVIALPTGGSEFELRYDPSLGLPPHIAANREYTLTLRVAATDLEAATHDFIAKVDGNGTLVLEKAEPAPKFK
jgi:hypothetical protein